MSNYITVDGDEHGVRIYTLENGLTVYLAQNFDAPRIQSYIAVRAGSNHDPKDNTGLAHYLEHLMFKGTSKIGAKNWRKEKECIDQIEELYEHHKQANTDEEKKKIYKKIDEISLQASEYALANEYDKCLSVLGATGTNAHTWLEETVYKNNIPSNELEKFLRIEAERFSEIIPRLFHTELETVYEEFNRAQDNDARLTHNALWELLFPTHPMGQQTTLGKAEHLKNPSIKAIKKFFDTYYVPNNMAIIMVGDLDFDITIRLIQQYFGKMESKDLPLMAPVIEKPIEKIQKRTVKSPSIPRVHLAWRGAGYKNREVMLLDLITNILTNRGACGLIDLNINFAQKALFGQAYFSSHNEYSVFSMVIVPKENQTLDDGVAMLLEELEKVKKGEFPEDMLTTIINDFKVQRIKELETANGLATNLYQTFIRHQPWEEEVAELGIYEEITKEEVIHFANDFFRDNFVIVYKEDGKNEEVILVDKPEITPITLNTQEASPFLEEIIAMKTEEISPKFIDYQKEISVSEVKGRAFSFVENPYNALASLYFIFPFGKDHDAQLGLVTQVLHYLGTDQYSADELKQAFYKIGIEVDFKTGHDEMNISMIGLEENLEKGIELLWHWLKNAQPDEAVYHNLVQTIEESRTAAKQDKTKVFNALQQYAKYGKNSRFRAVLSSEQLKSISCKSLTENAKQWKDYPFEIFYYGNRRQALEEFLNQFLSPITKEIPAPKAFENPPTEGKTYFVEYDMVQTELFQVAKGKAVTPEAFGKVNLFNEYFGSGLSSIVFQEIRERKSLAYSCFVAQQTATRKEEPDYFSLYLGTQPDKLPLALATIHELMSDFPEIALQYDHAKTSALKKIASGRIVRANIFFSHHRLKRLGVDKDIRISMYNEIQETSLSDLKEKYQKAFENLVFNTALIGKYDAIPWHELHGVGEVEVLTLEDIFGY